MATSDLYSEYQSITQKAADLQYAAAVLGWDQEVYMPSKGFAYRGRQLATLASQAHEIVTSEFYGDILKRLNERDGLTKLQKKNVQLSLEDYQKNKKLSVFFIEELTQQTSASYSAWLQAREKNDFSVYAPELKKMLALKRKQVDYFGYAEHPYDALLDEYEKGATVKMLDSVFELVKNELPPLLQKIKTAKQVSNNFLYQHFPKHQQWDFSIEVLKAIGYDFEAGRQDISEHPFTTSFAATDVRVTTRVNENDFASLLWSSIHEGGHALYEQGLLESEYGMPLGSPASLSIHESQSRLWENGIGRSLDFWEYFYPGLQSVFSSQLSGVSLNDFYKGINLVQPSLIRTEADELTYHFHVMIRYEIEKELLAGNLDVAKLPEAWNMLYEKYLGICPSNDKEGVLQDVHWCHGSFGYFPTYSLGSFYAAQFFEQARKEIPLLEQKITQGDFSELLYWLREKIHQHGRKYISEELCEMVTGKKLDFKSFIGYARKKYSSVYDISL